MQLKSLMRGRRLAVIGVPLALGTMSVASVALADDISNALDTSIDATPEVMSLTQNGATGSTRLYVQPRNGDGKNGCNITAGGSVTASVSSSDNSVATVSPTSVTFDSGCPNSTTGPLLTVTPLAVGSATVSVSETSNTTAGTFDTTPATFTVNVSQPPPSSGSSGVAGAVTSHKKKCKKKKKHKRSAKSAKKKKCKKKKKK